MRNFQFSIFNFQIKIIIVVFVILFSIFYFLTSNFISADEVRQDNNFVYLFHLYYDNGQLFADRDFEFKYDVIPESFVPEVVNTQFPFKGEVVNLLNQTGATFQFDPRRGDPNFLKGKISVKAPYLSDGQKTVFYDSQGRQLLTIFVSESSFCNDDGICNENTGENNQTCPNDCKGQPTTNNQQPTTGEGGQNNMIMWAIYVLIGLGAALGGWYGGSAIWRRWKKKQEPPTTPPTPSIPQFPQNPNVQ